MATEQSIADKNMTQIFKETITKNYINAKGRASRREYWLFQLALIIISFTLGLIVGALETILRDPETAYFFKTIIFVLLMLLITVPSICLSIRRLHDVGYSGWLILLYLVPFVSIVLFIFYILPSQEGSNKYGPNPYDEDDNNYQPVKENLEVNPAFKTPDIPNKIDPNKPNYKA